MTPKLRKPGFTPAAGLAVLLLALAVGACGSDDDEEGGARKPYKTEQAFMEAMIAHHESAIDMAEVAKRRGRHKEVKELAGDIVHAQANEIAQMEKFHRRLFGSEITPDPAAQRQLGLSVEAAGMMHMDAAAELEQARPFDLAFIDEMVPHHQGAIRMAHVLASKTDDPEMKRLAGAIIEAQSSEIESMNEWRSRWYGAPSPAGGVPEPGKDEALPGEEHLGQGHSG